MATYTLDANPATGTITISGGGAQHTDTLDKLQSSTGPYTVLNDLKIDQKVINYLDAIKDGTKFSELRNLEMYDTGYKYPDFTQLHVIENALLSEKKGNLSRTTWLKTKQDSRLNLIQTYHVFWESGLGYESFIELLQKGEPEIVTFGSYIDPLSKPGKIWPPRGNKIIITPNFMDQFGFGLSSITATTLADKITSGMNGGAFNYNMQVMCGTACNTPKKCEIADVGNNPDSNNVYFKGNGEKNKLVNKSGNSDLKTKLIVAKGWGDKVQVMLYYMYYHLHNKQAIMTTCDFVVFCFCITLNIPCVYTGIYDRSVDVQLNVRDPVVAGKSYYSILQFTPGTPEQTAIQNYKNTITRIYNENLEFIDNVSELALNPATPLFVQGIEPRSFSKTFYDILIADMKQINLILDAQKDEMEGQMNIEIIKRATDDLKRKYLIIPMFKYIKNGTKITFLQTKTYTSDKDLMKNMSISRQKLNSVSFYDMAKNLALGGAITRSQSRKIAESQNRELTNEQKEIFPKRDRKKKIARYLEEDINNNQWNVEREPLFIDDYGNEQRSELQVKFDKDFYKKIKTLIGEELVEGNDELYNVADARYVDEEHAAIAEGVAEPGCLHRVMNRFGVSSCSVMGGKRRNVTRRLQKGGGVDEILFETLYTLYVYRAQYDIELDTPDQLVNMNVLRELYEEYKQNNNESNEQEPVYNQQLKHKITVPAHIQRMKLTGNRRTARNKAPMRNRITIRNSVKGRHVKKKSHVHNSRMLYGGRITRRKKRNHRTRK